MNYGGILRHWLLPAARELPGRLGSGGPLTCLGAVEMRLSDGAVLFAHQPDLAVPVDSLTKLLTAILVEESVAGLALPIAATRGDIANPGVPFYIHAGESSTFADQLDGMIIKSDNNAAQLLARATVQHLDPRRDDRAAAEHFLAMMRDRAEALGLGPLTFDRAYSSGVMSAAQVAILLKHIAAHCPATLAAMASAGRDIVVATASGEARRYHVASTVRARDRRLVAGFVGGKTGTGGWRGSAAVLRRDEAGEMRATVALRSTPHTARFRDIERIIRAAG